MYANPCFEGIDDDANKLCQDLFDRKNAQKVGKKGVHKDSVQSMKVLQSSLDQMLVICQIPPLSCPSLNKGQTRIQPWFDQAISSDFFMSNDTQLELAIADFFHCENNVGQVVESKRFKYILKQAGLVGVWVKATKMKNWR